MQASYWKDTEDDPDRERRRQAELLVHQRVPWEVIEEIGVMDEAIKTRVEALLASASGAAPAPRVIVRTGWYYRERKS